MGELSMKLKKLAGAFVALSILSTSIGQAYACTAILITDTSGKAYKGRTLEFSVPVPTLLTYFPAGTKIESVTPAGKQGLSFNTKYAILGMAGDAIPGAKQPFIADASNDQGLTFSSNQLNNSSAPPVGSNVSKILSVGDLGAWILGNFKTTGEVKAAIANGSVDFWLPNVPGFGNVPLPQHYAIFDKGGNGIVIEFRNNKTNVYDNPVNVLTNGPDFPWHLTNLNNYTFTNKDQNTGRLGKLKLETQDAGIALSGLPSAQTATGRFVKAAFYANYVRKAKTPDEAITTLGHIMNNFDRPYDLTMDGAGGVGDGPRGGQSSSEVTDWTVMNDLSRNLFFFRSINSLNWVKVDMAKLKNLTQVKGVSIEALNNAGFDATNLFYK
jgi:choloylglycine hydrolase